MTTALVFLTGIVVSYAVPRLLVRALVRWWPEETWI